MVKMCTRENTEGIKKHPEKQQHDKTIHSTEISVNDCCGFVQQEFRRLIHKLTECFTVNEMNRIYRHFK